MIAENMKLLGPDFGAPAPAPAPALAASPTPAAAPVAAAPVSGGEPLASSTTEASRTETTTTVTTTVVEEPLQSRGVVEVEAAGAGAKVDVAEAVVAVVAGVVTGGHKGESAHPQAAPVAAAAPTAHAHAEGRKRKAVRKRVVRVRSIPSKEVNRAPGTMEIYVSRGSEKVGTKEIARPQQSAST